MIKLSLAAFRWLLSYTVLILFLCGKIPRLLLFHKSSLIIESQKNLIVFSIFERMLGSAWVWVTVNFIIRCWVGGSMWTPTCLPVFVTVQTHLQRLWITMHRLCLCPRQQTSSGLWLLPYSQGVARANRSACFDLADFYTRYTSWLICVSVQDQTLWSRISGFQISITGMTAWPSGLLLSVCVCNGVYSRLASTSLA